MFSHTTVFFNLVGVAGFSKRSGYAECKRRVGWVTLSDGWASLSLSLTPFDEFSNAPPFVSLIDVLSRLCLFVQVSDPWHCLTRSECAGPPGMQRHSFNGHGRRSERERTGSESVALRGAGERRGPRSFCLAQQSLVSRAGSGDLSAWPIGASGLVEDTDAKAWPLQFGTPPGKRAPWGEKGRALVVGPAGRSLTISLRIPPLSFSFSSPTMLEP